VISKSGNAILDAVKSGKISTQRLNSAVTRVLMLKQRLHLRLAG
jgi:hypothetical protein